MGKKYHQKRFEEKLIHWGVIGFLAIGLLSWVWPFLLAGGLGFGIYHLATKKLRLEKSQTAHRLQHLKDTIGRTDRQLQLLDDYLAKKDYNQYDLLSRQLLPQLSTIQKEATELRAKMGEPVYSRISNKVTQVTSDISKTLEELAPVLVVSKEERNIEQLAPEILASYQNIKKDDDIIREKLKTVDNRAELTALHDANMNRFEDILEGYLKIKQAPKDFYNAEERLALAKTALEQFDLDLDDTLRQLNEENMTDFEISLRLMTKTNQPKL